MSRAAYEAYFGQSAPSNAVFAADISYYQGFDVWYDLKQWADSVCIRTSYGAGGDDGKQAGHFAKAEEVGFTGTLGTYHYVIPNSGLAGNTNNYLSRSAPFVDRTKYDMLDFEESPVASNVFINNFCDAVEQTRQRPCLIYGGKSYLDQAGPIKCEAARFWVAHYAARGSNAWQPTNDWNSWNAPLMPNQYGLTLPGVWQWSSTAIGYGLDLDISTTPEAFGIGEPMDDWSMFMATNQEKLDALYDAVTAETDGGPRWAKNEARITQTWLNTAKLLELCTAIENSTNVAKYGWNMPNNPDQKADTLGLWTLMLQQYLVKDIHGIEKVDIEALASALAVKLTSRAVDYPQIRAMVRDELSKLSLKQG